MLHPGRTNAGTACQGRTSLFPLDPQNLDVNTSARSLMFFVQKSVRVRPNEEHVIERISIVSVLGP